MQRQSPPKHRHDGTSPLPLGMDWSPPPRNWAGKETVLPHDPQAGWCYFVTVPSWISLAKSRDSDPVVFYRIFVGIQSPEGIITTRTLLRRFNDFLKLYDVLKRSFPKKNIPATPPKGLLRMKTKTMLEERRVSLEEWMTRLLSDIEFSRSMAAASFLELEAAARLSFQEDGKPSADSHVSVNTLDPHALPHSSISLAGSSIVASENGSDTAYETSDIGSPSLGRDNLSEAGTEDLSFYEDINGPIDRFVKYGVSNIDEGLSMGQDLLEKIESFPKHKVGHAMQNGSYKASELAEDARELTSELNGGKSNLHTRKMSNESISSDKSSQKGNSLSNGLEPPLFRSGTEVARTSSAGDSDDKLTDDMQMVLPANQRQIVNRIITTVQRRLVNTKTDMEDLTSRLDQEIAVKEYLASKVKDLEVELETMKQKSKENLEQAIFIERERMTQMQWEMEELRHKSMEMELKLSSKQTQVLEGQSTTSNSQQKDALIQQLDSATQNYENLLKQHQELEGKFKSDMRVLAKEVKSLRGTQADLKQQLRLLAKGKSETEVRLREEQKRNHKTQTQWRKFAHKCKLLHEQLQECNIKNLISTQGDISSVSDPSDLVRASDDQISLLITEAQHLSENEEESDAELDGQFIHVDDDDELRETIYNILVENGMLRKQVNSLVVHSLEVNQILEKGDTEPQSDVN